MGEQLKKEVKELSDLLLAIDPDHAFELIQEYGHYCNDFMYRRKMTITTPSEAHTYAVDKLAKVYKDYVGRDWRNESEKE